MYQDPDPQNLMNPNPDTGQENYHFCFSQCLVIKIVDKSGDSDPVFADSNLHFKMPRSKSGFVKGQIQISCMNKKNIPKIRSHSIYYLFFIYLEKSPCCIARVRSSGTAISRNIHCDGEPASQFGLNISLSGLHCFFGCSTTGLPLSNLFPIGNVEEACRVERPYCRFWSWTSAFLAKITSSLFMSDGLIPQTEQH